jgi:Gpi18-like mannosyltransferase
MNDGRPGSWGAAIRWGVGIAVAQRLALLVWMAAVWLAVGERTGIPAERHVDPVANLPTLATPLERALFGVWRRWDASHYLNLAQNGYRADDPGPTVFGLLTPLAIRAFDLITPGPLDAGAMVFATAAFAFALAMLYRVCETYYQDAGLARRAVVALAVLPMSEAIYLALALGVFYAGATERWWLAAVCGALATLARSQGVFLAGILALMLLEHNRGRFATRDERLRGIIWNGLGVVLILISFGGFLLFRQRAGLPPLSDTYWTYSYNYIADPITGLVANIRWAAANPVGALVNPDLWALGVTITLTILMLRAARHRRPVLLAYVVGYTLVFVSRINFYWGGHEQVTNTQSFARYALTLFPLTVWIADKLRGASRRVQFAALGLSALGLLVFSAIFTLGGGSP